jgi:hypothetical protein
MLQKINWLGFGGTGIPEALPRAIAELQGFTVSGPLAGVGANTFIAVPGIDPWDTVIKALLFTAGVPSDITGNVTVVDRRASATPMRLQQPPWPLASCRGTQPFRPSLMATW